MWKAGDGYSWVLTLPGLKPLGFLLHGAVPQLLARSYRLSTSVLRVGMTYCHGDVSHPFGPDVPGRVEVSVVYRPAPTRPNPVRQRGGLIDTSAVAAGLAAGEEAVYRPEVLPVPHALVLYLPPELAQGHSWTAWFSPSP